MEPKGSFPRSQGSDTSPCPQANDPVHIVTLCIYNIHFNIILPPMTKIYQVISFLQLMINIFYASFCVTFRNMLVYLQHRP